MAVENILKIYPGMSAAATTKGRFAAFDTNGDIAMATVSGQVCEGVLTETVTAADEAVGIKIGIVEVVAGETIAKGDTIMSGATGKAMIHTTGGYKLGKALSAGALDGMMKVLVTGIAHIQGDYVKIGEIAVTGFTSTGVKAAWQNPEGAKIIIQSVAFDRTAAATGANTADIGTTAVSAATTSDNLIDGLDTNAAAAVNSNLLAAVAGTNGRPAQSLASGKWVTYDSKSGDATGLVGTIYIAYHLA